METLSELDYVNAPDSTQPPSDPSVVTAVAVTTVGTGSDGCDPCPLPSAADPLWAPVADVSPESSALGRNLAQIIDLSRPHGSLAMRTRARTLDSRLESHEALSSFDSTHSVAHSLNAVPICRPNSDIAASSAADIDPSVALDCCLARMILVPDPQACLDPPVAPSSVGPSLTSLSCERTAARPSDANLTSFSCERTAARSSDVSPISRSRDRTDAHSFNATLTPQLNWYTAASLADVNLVTSPMRQHMVGGAPQLPSLSSNQTFDDATPASPSLSPNQEFDDAPLAVPDEIEPSSLPTLDRRSRSLLCPGSLASACDPRPTALAPDLVLTNRVGSGKLDDAQQCSLPPRCKNNLSSRTSSQPLMHTTAAEAAVRRPRVMSLELAASTPTHVARLEGPSTPYAHTAAVPIA